MEDYANCSMRLISYTLNYNYERFVKLVVSPSPMAERGYCVCSRVQKRGKIERTKRLFEKVENVECHS